MNLIILYNLLPQLLRDIRSNWVFNMNDKFWLFLFIFLLLFVFFFILYHFELLFDICLDIIFALMSSYFDFFLLKQFCCLFLGIIRSRLTLFMWFYIWSGCVDILAFWHFSLFPIILIIIELRDNLLQVQSFKNTLF